MPEKVRFTEEEVKAYLDRRIRFWRAERKKVTNPHYELKAMCYVDAFQSVRTSLFNELLPPE